MVADDELVDTSIALDLVDLQLNSIITPRPPISPTRMDLEILDSNASQRKWTASGDTLFDILLYRILDFVI